MSEQAAMNYEAEIEETKDMLASFYPPHCQKYGMCVKYAAQIAEDAEAVVRDEMPIADVREEHDTNGGAARIMCDGQTIDLKKDFDLVVCNFATT